MAEPAEHLHKPGSPILRVNNAWRIIVVVAIGTAFSYKYYINQTRLSDNPKILEEPGAFRGGGDIEPAFRKSKYEGAGDSKLGRRPGNRFAWAGIFSDK